MIEYNKIFKKKDFIGVDDVFWDAIKKLVREKDYRYVIHSHDESKEGNDTQLTLFNFL